MRHSLVSPRDWLRIRWTLIHFIFLAMVARSRFWKHLKRIDEFDPMFNTDVFGATTLSGPSGRLYHDLLLELREFFHVLDFPEKWKNGRPIYKSARQLKKELEGFSGVIFG